MEFAVQEIDLGERGMRYLRDVLRTGGALGSVLAEVDLGAGRTTALWPPALELPEKLEWAGGLPRDAYSTIWRAVADKVMTHFAASRGAGWALSADRYNFGLGRFRAPGTAPRTRVRLARIEGRGVYYLTGAVDLSDIEDFLDAARVHWNVSALGTGGPLDSHDEDAAEWDIQVMRSLRDHVRMIMGSGFDELGFVFWERPF